VSNQKPEQSTSDQSFRLNDRSADTWETTPAAQSLERMKANPRVKYVVIVVPEDACPACQNLTGTYPKDQVPRLPIEQCSHPLGCRSYYLPYLDEIFP
jgi:DTW domain-containing protein YfiP